MHTPILNKKPVKRMCWDILKWAMINGLLSPRLSVYGSVDVEWAFDGDDHKSTSGNFVSSSTTILFQKQSIISKYRGKIKVAT